jgi:hypothetical protein
MPGSDPRTAARERDAGLRRVGRVSWRSGAAGVAAAAILAVAFGHHAAASTAPAGPSRQHATIVIPAQPPTASGGSGQVTSGAS